MKKEIPQIYNVEPAVASEEIEDEVDLDMFTQTLVLSSGSAQFFLYECTWNFGVLVQWKRFS